MIINYLQKSFFKTNFPVLNKKNIREKNIIYFDNSNRTFMPYVVVLAEFHLYKKFREKIINSRFYSIGNYYKEIIEETRKKTQKLINAFSRSEILFSKNSTESINMVAYTLYQKYIKEGDNILLTQMEHHSNLAPWIHVYKNKNIKINFIPIKTDGKLDLSKLDSLIDEKTKLVCITHISNVTGEINPVKEIIESIKLKNNNTLVLIDGCQAVGKIQVDVSDINCDIYIFSSHKMYGPTGIGILYVKENLLKNLDVFLTGGTMVEKIDTEEVEYSTYPFKFEAGTPNISGIIGFSKAIDYINNIGIESISQHNKELFNYAFKKMNRIKHVILYGTNDNKNKVGILSFNIKNFENIEIYNNFINNNIIIRTGNLCCLPLMKFFHTNSMNRISFAIYNDYNEIDIFIKILRKMKK